MPNMCCVPGCRGNYRNGPKVHVFKFPTDTCLLKKWISAIPRQNFEPSVFSRVCEKHFGDDNFIKSTSAKDSRTGHTVTVPLKIPRLRRDAVPTLFPNCPKYLSKDIKL
ncbi:THAP domain-containing protein 1-like [Coccinella septempunctata]|uniref:THAP domain-containing protein 1-like n=1 Tax=Coccinella septempunctata TaxID=41139 RepID=UPI001D08A508|nr:THAP domain-containing protein 1-like [Coccinella septempunctata]XP_044758442.1 THAP domain-containing protein 1-like [Coccinella septempunctata]XP_044767097.1 THAP domain-containing protein 1-like [Coccinella septempunctata]